MAKKETDRVKGGKNKRTLKKKSVKKLHKLRKMRHLKGGMIKTLSYMAKNTTRKKTPKLPTVPRKPVGMTDARWEAHMNLAKDILGFKGIPYRILSDADKDKISMKALENAEKEISRNSSIQKSVDALIQKTQAEEILKRIPNVPTHKP